MKSNTRMIACFALLILAAIGLGLYFHQGIYIAGVLSGFAGGFSIAAGLSNIKYENY